VKSERLFLLHIREAIARIKTYTEGGREAFFADPKTQDAVLRNLQTLAESTQRLSDTSRAAYSEVDWRAITGFRNVLVHQYLGVDLVRVWDIVETDLPVLKRAVDDLLKA
jgi:uncharacterized protein with HEPN domain